MVPPIGLIREYLAKENSQTFSELGYSSPSREALELTRRSSTDLPFIPYQIRSTSCREYVDLRCGSGLTLIQESWISRSHRCDIFNSLVSDVRVSASRQCFDRRIPEKPMITNIALREGLRDSAFEVYDNLVELVDKWKISHYFSNTFSWNPHLWYLSRTLALARPSYHTSWD